MNGAHPRAVTPEGMLQSNADWSAVPVSVGRHASIGGNTAFIIAMPRPQAPAECFFVAIVREGAGVGYYTLELSFGGATMMCGWSAEGAHNNYGPGPKPELNDFVAAVEALQARAGASH